MTFRIPFQISRPVPLIINQSVFLKNIIQKYISSVVNTNNKKILHSLDSNKIEKNRPSLINCATDSSFCNRNKYTNKKKELEKKRNTCHREMYERNLSSRLFTETQYSDSAPFNSFLKWCKIKPFRIETKFRPYCENKNSSFMDEVKEIKIVEKKLFKPKLIIVLFRKCSKPEQIKNTISFDWSKLYQKEIMKLKDLPVLESSVIYSKYFKNILIKARDWFNYKQEKPSNIKNKNSYNSESNINNQILNTSRKFRRKSLIKTYCLSKREYSVDKSCTIKESKNDILESKKSKKPEKVDSQKLLRPVRIYDDTKLKWNHEYDNDTFEYKPPRMDDVTGYKTKIKKLPKLVPSKQCTFVKKTIPTVAPKLVMPKKLYDDSQLEWKHKKIKKDDIEAPRSDDLSGNNEKYKILKRVHAKDCKLCIKI